MAGLKAIFDTNILIDYAKRLPAAEKEMSLYRTRAISIISWMEVLVGVATEDQPIMREYLDTFVLLQITADVAEKTVQLRRERKLKLPDAMIFATAMTGGWLFVTRNTKDFSEGGGIRVPYTI